MLQKLRLREYTSILFPENYSQPMGSLDFHLHIGDSTAWESLQRALERRVLSRAGQLFISWMVTPSFAHKQLAEAPGGRRTLT